MSEPQPPAPDDTEPPRSRATAIGTAAFLLLAVPFLVLGLWLLDMKSRVELRCEPGGPCVLTQAGWLTREEVARFPVEELRGVKVERTRSTRRDNVPIFRPELETARGKFPLFRQWATEEAGPLRVKEQVERFLAAPGAAPLELVNDGRRPSLRVGGAFTGVGVLLLVFSGWLALRTRAHRRAERAAALA